MKQFLSILLLVITFPIFSQENTITRTGFFNQQVTDSAGMKDRELPNSLWVKNFARNYFLLKTGTAANSLALQGKDTTNAIATWKYVADHGGTTPTSGFLYWNSTTNTYEPYSSYTAEKLYLGTTNPTGTIRFNLDGIIYASSFRTSNTQIRGAELYTSNASGVGLSATGNTGVHGINANGVGTGGYGVYASSYNSGGTALYANAAYNKVAVFEQTGSTGTTGVTSDVLTINRNNSLSSGSQNVSGNIITITDNPTGYTSISGKILSAIIGTTERISLNPRATSTTVPYIFDTENAVTGFLFRFNKQGVAQVICSSVGDFSSNKSIQVISENDNSAYFDREQFYIQRSTAYKVLLYPSITNTNNAIPYIFDTDNLISATGTKLFSVRNQGTEKVFIDKDGNVELSSSPQGVILKSPDGTRYKITVANGGTLTTTAL